MSEQVKDFNQALSVLIQGVEKGREKGIYQWEELDLISQSLKLIHSLSEKPTSVDESVDEEKAEPLTD